MATDNSRSPETGDLVAFWATGVHLLAGLKADAR
jgi:hypothetical protein